MTLVFGGQEIRFQQRLEGYFDIEATALWRASGKAMSLSAYLGNEQTKRRHAFLAAKLGIPSSAMVQTVRGGNERGQTWIHEMAAYDLALWLSDEAAWFVASTLHQLRVDGVVSLLGGDHAPHDVVMTKMFGETAPLIDPAGADEVSEDPGIALANLQLRELTEMVRKHILWVQQNRAVPAPAPAPLPDPEIRLSLEELVSQSRIVQRGIYTMLHGQTEIVDRFNRILPGYTDRSNDWGMLYATIALLLIANRGPNEQLELDL